nr:MAG TPA: hypothetical protein [Caudoviricetes sp.]
MSENFVTNFDVLGKNVKIKDENATNEINAINEKLPFFEKKTGFKSNDLDIHYLCRFYRDYMYKSETEQAVQQGCAIIDDSTAVCITIDVNSTYATLWKYNYKTGSILNSKSGLTGLGHANDATYNPISGYVEVALSYSKGLMRINPSTLAVVDTVATDNTFTGVSFDRKNNVLYGRLGDTVYKMNPNNYTVISSKVLNEPSILTDRISHEESYRQGMMCIDGLIGNIYWNPNTIIFYDYDTNEIVRYYNLPKVANEGNPVMEIESGDFITDTKFIFVTNHNLGNGYKEGTTFYECDLNENTITADLFRSITSTPTAAMYLYVDATATTNSPTGTKNAPFRYLQEAINCALCRNNNSVTIQLLTAGDYGVCYMNGLETPVRILGTTGATVNGIYVERSNSVDIRDIILNPVLSGNVTLPITINQSSVTLENCTINGFSTPSNYYCVVSNAKLTLYKCNITADKATAYKVAFMVGEKSSEISVAETIYSGAKLPEFAKLSENSRYNKRPCGNISTIIYEGGWGDTSCLRVCESQAMTIGTNFTMVNTDKIKTLGFEHNLMQVVFAIGGSRFPFTFRLYEEPFTQQLSFMTRMAGVWYRYVIVLGVNGNTFSIAPNNIIAVAENPSGTYSPTNLDTSDEHYPKLNGVEIMRV